MEDQTEGMRRLMVDGLNRQVESNDEEAERSRLEKLHGKVWNTVELTLDFKVHAFLAPFVMVTEKKTGQKGMMSFQHMPRFYFDFVPR